MLHKIYLKLSTFRENLSVSSLRVYQSIKSWRWDSFLQTLATTNLHCVTSQESEDLTYFAIVTLFRVSCNTFVFLNNLGKLNFGWICDEFVIYALQSQFLRACVFCVSVVVECLNLAYLHFDPHMSYTDCNYTEYNILEMGIWTASCCLYVCILPFVCIEKCEINTREEDVLSVKWFLIPGFVSVKSVMEKIVPCQDLQDAFV